MHGIQVQQRSGRSVNAVTVAAAQLAVCMALAGWLVSGRGLADPVQIPAWSITFQPPKGWEKLGLTKTTNSEAVRYRETAPPGRVRELTVGRRRNPRDLPAAAICMDEAVALLGIRHPREQRALTQWMDIAPLGPLAGARLVLPHGVYLHVGEWNPAGREGEAYILILVSERPLAPGDRSLAEALAGAIRLSDDD